MGATLKQGLSPISAISGIGAGIAGLFPTTTNTTGSSSGNTQGETNTSSSGNSNTDLQTILQLLSHLTSSTSGSSTSSPNLSPATQQLIDKLTSSYATLSKPVDLTGYQAGQTQQINRNSDLARQSADNIMASRGLATSPVSGTTDANIDNNRFGQINQLNQSIPLLKNQMNLQNLGAAAGFMNLIPHGTTTTNNQDQTQTQDQSQTGSQKGSTFTNNFGYQGSNTSTNNNTATKTSSGGGLGGLLHGLFG